ncbi:hypothetical protein J2737_004817, partial [Agrobacterium tumefaciens]|nr:hypothetical protein [Agrobacterium tumefaciens]
MRGNYMSEMDLIGMEFRFEWRSIIIT